MNTRGLTPSLPGNAVTNGVAMSQSGVWAGKGLTRVDKKNALRHSAENMAWVGVQWSCSLQVHLQFNDLLQHSLLAVV